ncbi:response regulator [Methanomicrobium sp. W14]|uniref:response regulator n=1 Tax=Methanomicrobium sp. W14 TaxID=2817839 RepID=UPI0032AFE704
MVEDDNLIAALIRDLLSKKHYAVAGRVSTGEEAIEMAIKHLPDLILMDIQLEGRIDGILATKYITSMFKIPVLFVSGEENDEIFKKAAESSPSGFIIKPFTANDIYSNIEIAVKNSQLKRSSKESYELPAVLAYKSLTEMDAYFLLDEAGRIIFINPYAEHMINRKICDVATDSINKYLLFYDLDTKQPIRDTFKNAVRESNFFGKKSKIAVKLASGNFRTVFASSLVVKDSFQNPIGTLFKVHMKSKGEL